MRRLFRAFFEPSLAPVPEGEVTLWLTRGKSKESIHAPLRKIVGMAQADEDELRAHAGDRNVYFSSGIRRPGLESHQAGKKSDIIALTGITIDFDFFSPDRPGAHKAQNLPRDLDEASALIAHLPDPGAIVDSGNGNHVHFFFREPIILDSPTRRTQAQKALKNFYKPLATRAKEEFGWHLDATSSIQHVFRVPGFKNSKTGLAVTLLYCNSDARCDPEDIGIIMPKQRGPRGPYTGPQERKQRQERQKLSTDLDAVVVALKTVDNQWTPAIKDALAGKSMAKPGERDKALQGVCSTIAWLEEGRKADPELLATILADSLQVWADEEGATKTLEEELEKAADKITRSQEDWHEQRADTLPKLDSLAKALGLPPISKSATVEEKADRSQFMIEHSIVQFKKIYFVWDYTREQYAQRAYQQSEIRTLVRDLWKDAPDVVCREYVNSKGQTRKKELPALMDEYGTVANDAIGSLVLDKSTFINRVFAQACTPLRVTEARFDKHIDTWLHALAGERYDKVCDWLAALPQLGDQNCALYLDGPAGTGKGMLAHGLARLWRDGPPTLFSNAIKDFNAEIIKCPLLWIDEGVPDSRKGITTILRSLVGNSSFSLNEKFEPTRPVEGAVRLLICANNNRVLMAGGSELSTHDLEAVVGRILYVPVQQAGANYLINYNDGKQLTNEWVKGDGLAKHCLYLYQNRKFTPGKRFLVEGDETEMHRQMILQGDSNGLVYEWLARFATNPEQVTNRYKGENRAPLAHIGEGKLLINTQCVLDTWGAYMPKETPSLNTTRIGTALGQVSERIARLGPRGDRNRYHVIEPDMILEWCRKNQVGNEDKIEDNLQRTLEIGQEV
jgi:hypothetical protein